MEFPSLALLDAASQWNFSGKSVVKQSVDPHGLAPWVNEIGRLRRTCTAIADPHELASWVNEIPGYRSQPSATDANASRLACNLVHPRGKLGGGPGVAESELY